MGLPVHGVPDDSPLFPTPPHNGPQGTYRHPTESSLFCNSLPATYLHPTHPCTALPRRAERRVLNLNIALIIRPRRDGERMDELRRLVQRWRDEGHTVTPRLTFEAGDAIRFARTAARARSDLVVAAGGDGTINEVVNGIGRGRWRPRLAILPLGTANDFAAGLGIPGDLDEAARIAISGHPIAVDVARVNRRLFVNLSTGGFGAEATEHTSPETKRMLGPLAYLVTGVRDFVELHPTRVRIWAGGRPFYKGDLLLFAVGNARQTGGGTLITPRAEFGDGVLDLVVVKAMPRLEFLGLLPDLRAGTHLESPGVLYTQVPMVVVEAEREISVNADGEPIRSRTFRYSISPRPLQVMAP